LGDVKHTIAKAEPSEWRDIPKFFEATKNKIDNIQIIRGNHDGNLEPLLSPTIKLHPSTGITLNSAGLFHGHTWPAKKLLHSKTLIMGHVHPTVAFRDALGFRITAPVWIKAKCDTEKLVNAFSKSKRIKTTNNPIPNSKKPLKAKPRAIQLFILPCFNDFLGGYPVNAKRERRGYISPILHSEAINFDRAEVYLLDGTILGTVRQLKTLS